MAANSSRSKGFHSERFYMNVFKELGYTRCITSRHGSKYYDDTGIDLLNLPFNVQIKAGTQKRMIPARVYEEITLKIKENFEEDSPESIKPLIVIHRPSAYAKDFRKDMVYISKTDLIKLNYKEDFTEVKISSQVLKTLTLKSEIVKVKFTDIFQYLKK